MITQLHQSKYVLEEILKSGSPLIQVTDLPDSSSSISCWHRADRIMVRPDLVWHGMESQLDVCHFCTQGIRCSLLNQVQHTTLLVWAAISFISRIPVIFNSINTMNFKTPYCPHNCFHIGSLTSFCYSKQAQCVFLLSPDKRKTIISPFLVAEEPNFGAEYNITQFLSA